MESIVDFEREEARSLARESDWEPDWDEAPEDEPTNIGVIDWED